MNQDSEVRDDDFAFVYLNVDYFPVAWLAYRGVMNSPDVKGANPGNLSLYFMDTVQRGLASTLRREGILEGFRQKELGEHISRLKCIYAWPSLEAAERGARLQRDFKKENLVAIRPRDKNFRRQQYDSTWITDFDALPADTGRRYWSGENSKNPLPECLLSGTFDILGTRVKKRAYATIEKANPNALAMLELSRLAAWCDSDLGCCAPWIKREGDQLVASFILRYPEIEGLQVFARAIQERQRDQGFQLNMVDLEPLTKKDVSPELDARFAVPDMRPYEKSFRIEKQSQLKKFARLVIDGS